MLKDKALDYKNEHFDFGEFIINGSELLDKMDSYEEWLTFVTKNAGFKELQLSVEKNNIPSMKIIKKNGGGYER